jgi:hypothetical protein
MTEQEAQARMKRIVFDWKRGARTGGEFAHLFLAHLTPDRLSCLRTILAKNYWKVIVELNGNVERAPKTAEEWSKMIFVEGGSFALPPDPEAAAQALQQREQRQEEGRRQRQERQQVLGLGLCGSGELRRALLPASQEFL